MSGRPASKYEDIVDISSGEDNILEPNPVLNDSNPVLSDANPIVKQEPAVKTEQPAVTDSSSSTVLVSPGSADEVVAASITSATVEITEVVIDARNVTGASQVSAEVPKSQHPALVAAADPLTNPPGYQAGVILEPVIESFLGPVPKKRKLQSQTKKK